MGPADTDMGGTSVPAAQGDQAAMGAATTTAGSATTAGGSGSTHPATSAASGTGASADATAAGGNHAESGFPLHEGATAAPPSAPVDDLHFIQGLVDSGDVVGSMPHVDMPASEKRRLVEEQIARGEYAGATSGTGAAQNATTHTSVPAADGATHAAIAEDDGDSDSSSEYETSDEERAPRAPPSPGTHAAMRAELDKFVGASGGAGGPQGAGDDSESSSETASDTDSSVDLDGKLGAFGLELVDSDDDDGAAGALPAITSAHERPLPPVSPPPLARVTGDLVIAGDVVRWMKDRAVEAWIAAGNGKTGAEKSSDDAADVDMADDKTATAQPDVKPDVDMADAKTTADAAAQPEPSDTKPDIAASTDTKPTQATSADDVTMADDKPAAGANAEAAMTETAATAKTDAPAKPQFTSSGTVIIRAMQEPGTGWLEEGSVLCFADGRVLGCVGDTFGPLTSPFYLVRLPPPPFPYPSEADLEPGAKVYFPAQPQYRTYVDMHAVRDPRFRSDASNLWDEEVGDDEVEWSDDEAESAAKRRGKKKKGKRGGAGGGEGDGRGGRGGRQIHSLPPRPHVDHADGGGVGPGGRQMVAYDDDLGGQGGGHGASRRGRGRGGGARGRGQGGPIGQGRTHALPPRPAQPAPAPGAYSYASEGYNPGQPGMAPVPYPGYDYAPTPTGPTYGTRPSAPYGGYYHPAPETGYTGYGAGAYAGYGAAPTQYTSGAGGGVPAPDHSGAPAPGANAPAINPRFAAQYMMGGYWPQGDQGGAGGHPGSGGGGSGGGAY